MERNFLYRLCRNALWWIALVMTTAVFLLNVFYISEVSSSGYEVVTISGHVLPGVLMLVIIGCIMLILRNCRKVLESLDEKKLFWLLTGIYAVFAAYLIFNVDSVIRADAKTVFNTALEAKEGIYAAFRPGHYMYRYPHQLGLMTYDRILSGFSENPQFIFFVNFLFVVGINHTVWKISDHLFRDRLTNILTILLSFAFLPQLFFILFAYGLIPGFFFIMMGFCQCLQYAESENPWDMAAMLLSVIAAVLLKQNFLIGGIAIGIFLFLRYLQDKRVWKLVSVFALAICMTVPGTCLKQLYELQADVSLDNPSPSVLWIAMGTDIDNSIRGPGWYDSSSWNLYNDSEYNTEVASDLGKDKLYSNWQKIQAEPARAGKFFLDKTISQWCDPMYESVWSGPLEDCGQYTHTDILKSLYSGGRWAEWITICMKLLCLALWIFAAWYLLLAGKETADWTPMYLYFIGGLLFHTFWEGKSQYTYPYLFVLIPFAGNSIKTLITKHKLWDSSR